MAKKDSAKDVQQIMDALDFAKFALDLTTGRLEAEFNVARTRILLEAEKRNAKNDSPTTKGETIEESGR